jgi:hypothetical protein
MTSSVPPTETSDTRKETAKVPENGVRVKAKEVIQRLDEEVSRFPRIEPAYTNVKRRVQRVVDDPRVRATYESEVKPRVEAAVTRLEGLELFTLRLLVALLYQLETVLDGMRRRFGEPVHQTDTGATADGSEGAAGDLGPVTAADSLNSAVRKLRSRARRVRLQLVQLLSASMAGARRVGDQAGIFLAEERTSLFVYAKRLITRLLSMLKELADYGLNALGKEDTTVLAAARSQNLVPAQTSETL